MNTLVNDENTYKKLKSDPSKKLQRNLNQKLWPLHLANNIKKPLYSKLHCSVAQTPKLYGLPKIHKQNTPMRPIVSFCSSPTYELSKYLARILKPLTERSEHRLVNSADFITKIRAETISDTHELVSFDVKSLFTSIPLQLAIECMKESLANYDDELPIPKEEIIDLLKLCLESTFFQYNGSFYQQLHGTAMGSPVSVVVAEIVMQRLEERALSTYPNPPPFWFRYVDDTLTSVSKHQKNDFLDHLNKQNPNLQFTMEPEKDGKIAFLDCMITRDGNCLRTSVYRKPTSTSRLLDDSSYHPTSHKSATVATLVKRAHAVCSSNENLEDELQHLNKVFTINNYSKPFVDSVTERSRRTTPTSATPTTGETEPKKTIATIPYIKGTSERIARILRPFNISVAHKPTVTLRNILMKVKDPTDIKTRTGAIYKVTCAECPATYVGETGRTLDCRIKEHKRATEKKDLANKIAVHQMETKHRIEWEGATCMEFNGFADERMFLESWFTKCDENSINICRDMPGAYAGLIANERRLACFESTREQTNSRTRARHFDAR